MANLYLSGEVGVEITAKRIIDFLASTEDEKINVYLNSPGGSVDQGIEIYNLLRSSGRKIKTILTSTAYSMGSIIFLAGDERVAMTGTRFMVHEPWGVMAGKSSDLREGAEELDSTKERLMDIYNERTSISNMEELVNSTTFFNTKEMKEKGITTSEKTMDMQALFIGEAQDMAKIDDLKAELEELKVQKAKMEEEKAEAQLAKEVAEMKAELESMREVEVEAETEKEKAEVEVEKEVEAETESKTEEAEVKETTGNKKEEVVAKATKVVKAVGSSIAIPAFMKTEGKY